MARLKETIQVVSAAPTVDTTSTTIGASLDSATLSRLPVGRRFSDTLYLAPGVSTGGSVGTANPSIEGSSGLENQYVVDGVNITNGGYGALGSYSIVFGSLGNGTPYDFMQEVQVKTGGYEAEFGQATGGVINVVTKSGSNALQGQRVRLRTPAAVSSPLRHRAERRGNGQHRRVAAQRRRRHGGRPGRAQPPVLLRRDRSAVADEHLQGAGRISARGARRRRPRPPITNYAAKAPGRRPARIASTRRSSAIRRTATTGPQRTSSLLKQTTSGFSSLDYGGHNQTVHYDGVLSSHFLLEARSAARSTSIIETPSVNDWQVTDFRVTPRVITGGLGSTRPATAATAGRSQAKATNILARYGQHQVRYGFDYEHLDYSQLQQFTGPTFTAPNGQQTATGAVGRHHSRSGLRADLSRRAAPASPRRARRRKRYGALFVEDEWKIGNSLTIRPGVRYEQETLSGTLIQGFSLKNNWAPRLGVVWDPTRQRARARCSRTTDAITPGCRTISRPARCRPTPSITADYFDAEPDAARPERHRDDQRH